MNTIRSAAAIAARLGPSRRATALTLQRPFGTSAARRSGKEEKLHTDGRADEVEHHKHDQLQKQREGKGHWKDELASNSESIIKAERGEIEASEDTIRKLQQETVRAAKKKA